MRFQTILVILFWLLQQGCAVKPKYLIEDS